MRGRSCRAIWRFSRVGSCIGHQRSALDVARADVAHLGARSRAVIGSQGGCGCGFTLQ